MGQLQSVFQGNRFKVYNYKIWNPLHLEGVLSLRKSGLKVRYGVRVHELILV